MRNITLESMAEEAREAVLFHFQGAEEIGSSDISACVDTALRWAGFEKDWTTDGQRKQMRNMVMSAISDMRERYL